jgi:hypothetical protein
MRDWAGPVASLAMPATPPKAKVNSARADPRRTSFRRLEIGIVCYEFSDVEWTAIKPMLPNKICRVRLVKDRRPLNRIF